MCGLKPCRRPSKVFLLCLKSIVAKMIHGVFIRHKKRCFITSNTKNKASKSVNTPECEKINLKSFATEKKTML